MKKLVLILALVLILIPTMVHAADSRVLLGMQTVSFGGDISTYYDVPPGMGITLMASFDPGLPVDLRIGRRTTTEGISKNDFTYQWIEVGPRFNMGVEGTTIQPDWFFGIGKYDIELGNSDFDTAYGGYIGFGVEEALSEADKFVGRLEIKTIYFKSDTFNTDVTALNISLLFGFKL